MSFVSLLSMFYFAGVKMATLTVKVDTMWQFTMRRAVSEAVSGELMVRNSPLEITAKGYAAILPLADDLAKHFKLAALTLEDNDLALEIERAFGERILLEVCIPNNLALGACLLLAIEAVRKHDTFPGNWDDNLT
jgi:hypothetical protein